MFDQTFVDGAGKTRKGWTVTVSFALECVSIGLMILAPLVWTEVLPKAQSMTLLMAPAPPPPPAAPPPQARVIHTTNSMKRVFNRDVLAAPPAIPSHAAMITEDTVSPDIGDAGSTRFPAGPLALLSGPTSFVGNPLLPPVPAPKPEVKPQAPEKPLMVGGKVQSAKLVRSPKPPYPYIAKITRVQGSVVLQAIIGKDGTVQNLKVLSAASPLLIQSAMDAVKQWVYQPTLLNGEAVEVMTEITVTFALQ